MPIYRPRMILLLIVPEFGDAQARRAQQNDSSVFTIDVNIRRAEVVSNDHNHADECRVVADFRDVGTDVRLLRNACGVLYMGNADDFGRWNWQSQPTHAQFCGILAKSARRGNAETMEVELEFLDYTCLFLKAKPFGQKGVPDFSQKLDEAWRRIVSQTPGAEVLADALEFQGVDEIPVLGKAVAKRFSKLGGKVPVKPRTDAWAVWQTCVGMLGLVSYIERDKCIVTTATNYYTREDPPRLVWGKNISEIEETREDIFRKGVIMASYDPLSRRTVEAFWPPIGDGSIRKKNIAAKKLGNEAAVLNAEDREEFQCPYPTTDPQVLEDVAKRVYEERSRQELQGTAVTSEMRVETMDGKEFDLLTLRAGDSIRIEFDVRDREMLVAFAAQGSSIDEMSAYLQRRGYRKTLADLMARNADCLSKIDPTFLVKRVDTSLEFDEDGVTFAVKVTYVNRILVDGSTDK